MSQIRKILGQRWPWLAAAGLVVGLYFAQFVRVSLQLPAPERPNGTAADIEKLSERDDVNVLFILVDTLRADRLSTYGYERPTAPFLDELAENGVVFGSHLAQSSWTKCSMASLWTGLYPVRSGVTRFEHVLSQDARMPAEVLAENGFLTAGLYRNGWVEGYFGFDQGFDVYTRPTSKAVDPSIRLANPTLKAGGTDEDAVLAAMEFFRIYGNERWFLYLHLMDVHEYLYDEDSAQFGTDYSSVYDNSVLRTNLVIRELYKYLEREGYLENTLIVITSDHGEAFGERGAEGHARGVYRETTEVPLIMSLPFKIPGGVVVDQPTQNVDVWPTILDLLGIDGLGEVDGKSQVPALLAAARNESIVGEGASFAHLDQNWGRRGANIANTVSVLEDGYRYMQVTTSDGSTKEELFNSRVDTAELTDLINDEAETTERLRSLAEGYLEQTPPWDVPDALEIDEIQLNQLRALGYSIP
ncbi:MAG: sulfatase [Myxococcota bacterium]|nr:sulfatase [Myxococcota bacterium]